MKKYIFPILVLIAFLGIAHHQQEAAPNQEIVLQFKNVEVSANKVQTAIHLVENELQNLGVQSFQIKESENGTLNISYYSNADVAVVKRLLSKRIKVELETTGNDEPAEFPDENDAITYNLDVFEINNGSNPDSGFNGIIVNDYRTKADRLSKPKVFANQLDIKPVDNPSYTIPCLKENATSEIAIQYILQKIPDVRAGPSSY